MHAFFHAIHHQGAFGKLSCKLLQNYCAGKVFYFSTLLGLNAGVVIEFGNKMINIIIIEMLKSILFFEECARSALDVGAPVRDIISMKSKNRISEAKFYPDHEKILNETDREMKKELEEMVRKNAA